MVPLSILDLSVVTTGTKPAAALRNSIDQARHAAGSRKNHKISIREGKRGNIIHFRDMGCPGQLILMAF